MGLDITAYSHLTPVGQHEKDPALNEGEPGGLEDWCYYENHVQAFAYDTFPRSFRGISVLGTKTARDGSNFLEGGCYAITPETETHRFGAGSYGSYNWWRRDLARQFNPYPAVDNGMVPQEPDPDEPFYELIWFADNEGCIGPEAASDLLADFREHGEAYEPKTDWAEPAQQHYRDWTRAFELASVGGLVRFH